MLAQTDCADFAQTVLDAVSKKNPVYPSGGSLSDVFEDDPKSLPGKGNTKDCSISVSFEAGTSFPGVPALKNGPGSLSSEAGGFPFFDSGSRSQVLRRGE